jgi:hypothetical protein
MRKFLGFVALFALGFAAGAYVLNTYFPQRDGVRRVVAAPAGETDAERSALTNLLEQRPQQRSLRQRASRRCCALPRSGLRPLW